MKMADYSILFCIFVKTKIRKRRGAGEGTVERLTGREKKCGKVLKRESCPVGFQSLKNIKARLKVIIGQ